jgi:CarboxypepD_reg-like domain
LKKRDREVVVRQGRRVATLAGVLLLIAFDSASAQSFVASEVRTVIRSVEASSSFRFLYRDALIAGHTVSLTIGEDPVEDLSGALRAIGLGVRVDRDRRQVLIYRKDAPRSTTENVRISGEVLDDATGARLPFATVTWIDKAGRLRGVVCNESGRFEARLQPGQSEHLTVSYLGYETTSVAVVAGAESGDLAVRLRPRPVLGREVIVSGSILNTDLDTTWQHLLSPGVQAPLGESSVLRSLQSLPSVSLSTALSDGLAVRGSKADGFQVLLDGLPIYSQTHMFGLFDAFNEDALQAVAFYYGVVPASYQGPPGGTVSFLTRTGSQERVAGAAGVSSTSLRGTLEGPIAGGKGSWLISGRRSYLGEVDWFGNDALIAQGLDVGRETSLETDGRRPFEVLSGDADYYDAHAKLSMESSAGGRFTVTGYSGGDRTTQAAQRRMAVGNVMGGQQANAQSRWGASSLGTRYQRPGGGAGYLSVLSGVSTFFGEYRNDSVVGVRRPDPMGGPNSGPGELRLEAFTNYNRLRQFRLAPEYTWGGAGVWKSGADFNVYDATYTETSSSRPDYVLSQSAVQVDLYADYASPRFGAVSYEVGLRSHWYSAGDYLRLSPRVDLRLGGEGLISGSLGYSRNHQFLHKLEVQPVQESAPDVWILSSETESPGQVDYWTAGIYLRPSRSVFLQVEAFLKEYANLRLHETATPNPRNQSLVSEINNPWLTDVDGRARGLEFMLRHRTGPVVWSHAYSLSKTVYNSPRLLDGSEFPVSWDRRHQYTAMATASRGPFSANLTWSIASGTPNALSFGDSSEEPRLPVYHRLDVGLTYKRQVGMRQISAGFSLYNAYDKQNTWYRASVPQTLRMDNGVPRVTSVVSVDVYDLGVHPSFELGIRF